MAHGSIIGYDINAKMCQISYYNEQTQEPETVDTGIEKENNQIPLVMNYYKETWTYGRQARRMSTVRDSICVDLFILLTHGSLHLVIMTVQLLATLGFHNPVFLVI